MDRIRDKNNVYVIAELSANHNGSLERAMELVRAAAQAGADAIKLQTYTADTMTIDCDRDEFKIQGGLWDGRTLYDLYKEAYTPWEWHAPLRDLAHELGLDFFSTPFDSTAVDFLEKLDVPVYKIASFELVDIPLIEYVAAIRKPIILSTGMGTLEEIELAVSSIRKVWGDADPGLCLLKCTSAYPASPAAANLRTIVDLAARFGVVAGLSDHTLGTTVAVAAVAVGAKVIEKHLTLSRGDPGPDSAFSLEPHEFAEMVTAAHIAERSLGEICYEQSEAERPSTVFRRSLFCTRDVQAGERFTTQNTRCIRPGNGLPPRYLERVLQARAIRTILRGSPLTWSDLDEDS
ncbi:MAG: pseudaminic acid synthase [Pseudomonadota bacterium]